MSDVVRRPAEVTVVVVLTYVSAIASIVVGVVLILARYGIPAEENTARTVITIAGAIVVLIGFLTVAVASGISRGDRSARIIATVLLGLVIAVSLLSLAADQSSLWSTLAGVVIDAAAVIVLWTGRARAYFGQPTVA